MMADQLNEHHLTVQRTARYYVLGEPTEKTRNIWFCLHGFGQLAQYFSRKFTDVVNDETLVVVPEGLSRLYLNGEYKRVGASWLTHEDRDYEVADFVAYLNTLYDTTLGSRPAQDFHITLFGFSQGAATACRWLSNGHIRADRLMLWAGFFANGMADLIDPQKLTDVETHYVYGSKDEFLTLIPDSATYLDRIRQEVPGIQITEYEGEHRVEPAVLQTLLTTKSACPSPD